VKYGRHFFFLLTNLKLTERKKEGKDDNVLEYRKAVAVAIASRWAFEKEIVLILRAKFDDWWVSIQLYRCKSNVAYNQRIKLIN
jgi:hypothetical protein